MKLPFLSGRFRFKKPTTKMKLHPVVVKKHKAHLSVLIADTLFWTIDGFEKFGMGHILMVWGVGLIAVTPIFMTILGHFIEFAEEGGEA